MRAFIRRCRKSSCLSPQGLLFLRVMGDYQAAEKSRDCNLTIVSCHRTQNFFCSARGPQLDKAYRRQAAQGSKVQPQNINSPQQIHSLPPSLFSQCTVLFYKTPSPLFPARFNVEVSQPFFPVPRCNQCSLRPRHPSSTKIFARHDTAFCWSAVPQRTGPRLLRSLPLPPRVQSLPLLLLPP